MKNPFPRSEGAIEPGLFVGRQDLRREVRSFLLADPADGPRKEVWVIPGKRGQGKSSLARVLFEDLAQDAAESVALSSYEWIGGAVDTLEKPLARTLYRGLVHSSRNRKWGAPGFPGHEGGEVE